MASLQQVATVQQEQGVLEFQKYVLDYITEWDSIVTSQLDKELKLNKKLQQDLLHYERKVDGLRKKVASLEQNPKKSVPELLQEKLERNEEKLQNAHANHEFQAGKVCILLEQVTKFGWKDLYPLLKNALKWEVNRLGRENLTYGKFPKTLDSLKQTFQENIWSAFEEQDENEASI